MSRRDWVLSPPNHILPIRWAEKLVLRGTLAISMEMFITTKATVSTEDLSVNIMLLVTTELRKSKHFKTIHSLA